MANTDMIEENLAHGNYTFWLTVRAVGNSVTLNDSITAPSDPRLYAALNTREARKLARDLMLAADEADANRKALGR